MADKLQTRKARDGLIINNMTYLELVSKLHTLVGKVNKQAQETNISKYR